jgi:hypothetical protein
MDIEGNNLKDNLIGGQNNENSKSNDQNEFSYEYSELTDGARDTVHSRTQSGIKSSGKVNV